MLKRMGIFERLFGASSTVDPNFSEAIERVEQALAVVEERDSSFLACSALLLAQVAHNDSEICENEKEQIFRALREYLHLSEEKALAAASVAVEHALSRSIERHLVLRRLNECANHQQKHDLVRAMFEVASIEDITEAESDEIAAIANALYLPRPEFTAIRAEYNKHRAILKGLK